MKKSILILAIILLGGIAYSQDTTTFIPNYGIELGSYSDVRTFGADLDTTTYLVKFMYPQVSETGVTFWYDIKAYNKGKLTKQDNFRLVLPLNAIVNNKKV